MRQICSGQYIPNFCRKRSGFIEDITKKRFGVIFSVHSVETTLEVRTSIKAKTRTLIRSKSLQCKVYTSSDVCTSDETQWHQKTHLSQGWSACCCSLLAKPSIDKHSASVLYTAVKFTLIETCRSHPKSHQLLLVLKFTPFKNFTNINLCNSSRHSADRWTDSQTDKYDLRDFKSWFYT